MIRLKLWWLPILVFVLVDALLLGLLRAGQLRINPRTLDVEFGPNSALAEMFLDDDDVARGAAPTVKELLMPPDSRDWVMLISKLGAAGYFDRVLEADSWGAERAAIWARAVYGERYALIASDPTFIANSTPDFDIPADYRGLVGREFPADAEELAEGGVAAFLKRLAPYLAGQGVPHLSVTQERTTSPYRYTVSVNNRAYVIWGAEDEGRSPGRVTETARAIAIVNRLLAQGGSSERAYALHLGAEDGRIIFLTDEQQCILTESPLIPKVEQPVAVEVAVPELLAGMSSS